MRGAMDFRLLYIIALMVAGSYADSCLSAPDGCSYIVTCYEFIDPNLQWTQYSPYQIMLDESCETPSFYERHPIYAVKLIFRIRGADSNQVVPVVETWDQSADLSVILQSLDMSNNEYTQMPTLRNMPNLKKLDFSNNHLTTAVLSNLNELAVLTEIDLSYNTISNIQVNPYHYPYKALVKIILSHNYIVKVPDSIFDEFDDLQVLDLSFNYIDTLTQLTFEGIKKLTELNLCHNRLSDISNALFRFNLLKILNLSENKLKTLNIKDFEHLRNLETLDLRSNLIKSINSNTFITMFSLTKLDLGHNQLEVVTKNTFANLKSLQSIDLSNNKLRTLQKGLFANVTIYEFSIAENGLEGTLERGMFDGVNVTTLDLSHQQLTEIQDYAFNELKRLNTLLLNSNNIHSLSSMSFKTLRNVQEIDLSDNQITSIDFNMEDLINLKSLMLKNNRLSEIKHEQLKDLTGLEYLDLSGNQIFRLEPKSFQSLRYLINLKINDNPLTGTIETDTFDGLVLLPSLDISHNMLTTIQNASFKYMTKLTELNLTRCQIRELQYNAFIDTGYIETLDLSYNQLQDFAVNTTDLVALSTLLLNNNQIKTISLTSLGSLLQLNKLILSNNIIEDIANGSFENLIDLRHLDLSYNEKLKFTLVMLENNKNLDTLILSGIKNNITFEFSVEEKSISHLKMSNASVQNISALNLNALPRLDTLDLSFNNVSKLLIGDFSNISTIRFLDLSFNKISYIQPGVFKNNTVLISLNISHNSLSSIGYGVFRGLTYLSILDMSYNQIKDLQSERFYEVKSLTQLIVDSNKINAVNAEEFAGTSLAKLSIGDNPLPCQILVKLTKNGTPFEITAIRLDEHSNENVNGITCNKDYNYEPMFDSSDRNQDNSQILNGFREVLNNFTNKNLNQKNVDIHFENLTNVFDEKLSYLAKITYNGVAVNNNTNMMLSKIIELLQKTSVVISTTTAVPMTETARPTTQLPLIENKASTNKSVDVILYIDKIKKELESAIKIQKQNILKEIETKLASNNYQTESIPITHEKLVTSNENGQSVFTETCVALILVILVGLVLYKFYKSRMFVRNRFSISTRELPGAMENSAL